MKSKESKRKADAVRRSSELGCSVLDIARKFHNTYEYLAPSYGYETSKATREFDPASPNGKLMQATCLVVVGPYLEKMKEIASMPEYDQDDAHRLRDKARWFLLQNPSGHASASDSVE